MKESERKNFVVDIATDTFIAIFSFLTRRELGNSMELVCRRINLIKNETFRFTRNSFSDNYTRAAVKWKMARFSISLFAKFVMHE